MAYENGNRGRRAAARSGQAVVAGVWKRAVSAVASAAIASAFVLVPAASALAEPFIGGEAQVPQPAGSAVQQPVVASMQGSAPVFTLAIEQPWEGDVPPSAAGTYDQEVLVGGSVQKWCVEVTDAWRRADGAAVGGKLQAKTTYVYEARVHALWMEGEAGISENVDLRLLNAKATGSAAFWDSDPEIGYVAVSAAPSGQPEQPAQSEQPDATAAGEQGADGSGAGASGGGSDPIPSSDGRSDDPTPDSDDRSYDRAQAPDDGSGAAAGADASGRPSASALKPMEASASSYDLLFTARYTPPAVIASVQLDLQGLAPALKALPPLGLNASAGSGYYVAKQFWLDSKGAEVKASASAFKANKTYYYTAQVAPAGQAVFREGVTKVELAGTGWADAGSVVVSVAKDKVGIELAYTFPKKAPTDFTKLASTIGKAVTLDQQAYTSKSWKKLLKALEAGYKVLADASASQKKVDKAQSKIAAATKALAKLPATVALKSVKAGKKRVTVTWKKVKGVKFQVCYKAKGAKKWAKKKAGAGATKLVVKKLKQGKAYQVKVRAYKKIAGKTEYSASWSTVKTSKKVK